MAVRVKVEPVETMPRREREQMVADVNLFLVLRDQLPKGDLRALRNELAHLVVADEPEHGRTDEIHPVTGKPVASQEEQAQLGFRSLLQFFATRRQLLGEDTITAPQVAELLGVSRQTPLNRVKEKTLLGVLDRGAWRFPLWQFDPEGPDGVLSGLPEVLKALEPQQAFSKLVWLRRRNQTLGRKQPIELLRLGETQPVADAARAASQLP